MNVKRNFKRWYSSNEWLVIYFFKKSNYISQSQYRHFSHFTTVFLSQVIHFDNLVTNCPCVWLAMKFIKVVGYKKLAWLQVKSWGIPYTTIYIAKIRSVNTIFIYYLILYVAYVDVVLFRTNGIVKIMIRLMILSFPQRYVRITHYINLLRHITIIDQCDF